jgi:hypothetical protein
MWAGARLGRRAGQPQLRLAARVPNLQAAICRHGCDILALRVIRQAARVRPDLQRPQHLRNRPQCARRTRVAPQVHRAAAAQAPAFVSATFTSLIPSSSPAAASLVPSGLKATARTGSVNLVATATSSRPGSL